jgi:hypothetical protein
MSVATSGLIGEATVDGSGGNGTLLSRITVRVTTDTLPAASVARTPIEFVPIPSAALVEKLPLAPKPTPAPFTVTATVVASWTVPSRRSRFVPSSCRRPGELTVSTGALLSLVPMRVVEDEWPAVSVPRS